MLRLIDAYGFIACLWRVNHVPKTAATIDSAGNLYSTIEPQITLWVTSTEVSSNNDPEEIILSIHIVDCSNKTKGNF